MSRAAEERLSVSVVLATYNGAAYLGEQLQSLSAQTRLPDELIVSDDGSTDLTAEIAAKFASDAPFRVVMLRHPHNLGADKNFAAAIGEATSDLVFCCDQDDRWAEDKIALMSTPFEADAGVGMVMCDASIVDERLSPTGSTIWNRFGFGPELQQQVEEGIGFAVFARKMPVYGCTIAVRRSLASFYLPIPDGVSFDAWIGQIVSVVADVRLVRRPLLDYRQHSAQVTGFDSGSRFRRLLLLVARSDVGSVAEEANRLVRLLERLHQLPSSRAREIAERLTADRLQITRRRMRIRRSYGSRIPIIISGLIRGEYRRGAQGIRSAGVDLLSRRQTKE